MRPPAGSAAAQAARYNKRRRARCIAFLENRARGRYEATTPFARVGGRLISCKSCPAGGDRMQLDRSKRRESSRVSAARRLLRTQPGSGCVALGICTARDDPLITSVAHAGRKCTEEKDHETHERISSYAARCALHRRLCVVG